MIVMFGHCCTKMGVENVGVEGDRVLLSGMPSR